MSRHSTKIARRRIRSAFVPISCILLAFVLMNIMVNGTGQALRHVHAVDNPAPSAKSNLPPADPALAPVAWLAGSWIQTTDKGSSEEHWTSPLAGTMLGVNRTVADGKTEFYEFLRIEAGPNGLVYHAAPKGRYPPTAFRMTESAERRVVFENRSHDFPQRIIYELVDGGLRARIEGERNGKQAAEEWRWQRASGSTNPQFAPTAATP